MTPPNSPSNQSNAGSRSGSSHAPRIALVGDYSPDVIAHRAIPQALELARSALGADIGWQWFQTRDIQSAARDLAGCAGLWVVPASPYVNMAGALGAIRCARESGQPFLGTCGGFQHAVIEFARHVAGLATADHAESNDQAEVSVVTPLVCPLVEKTGRLHFTPGSQLRSAYGSDQAEESYHCRYGLNPEYRARLEKAGLRFSGFDDEGGVRALELPSHPFFIGTLFQPERSALRSRVHPLIRAFVQSVSSSG